MKTFSYHSMSTSSRAGLPSTSAWKRSGNMVEEWLPHTVMRRMRSTPVPVFLASWALARLWSSRVMAVKFRGLRPGAFL